MIFLRKLIANQKGLAMPLALMIFVIVMIITISALAVTVNQSLMTSEYTASVDALHFAESGINELLWHLNKADPYGLPIGEDIEIVFADESVHDGMYRLEFQDGAVDEGYVVVRSTGFHKEKPGKMRTIEAVMSKKSFTEYVWLSNTEDQGPGFYDKVWNISIHEWNGPFHTNNNINITGTPTFNGPVTYVNKIITDDWDGEPNPDYNAGEPREVESIEFPSTNSEILARAKSDGHYYNGMTAIFLNGDSYDVRTYDREEGKWYFNGVQYEGNEKPAGIESLSLPDNGVIYVDGAGSTQWRRGTGDLYVSGEIDGRLTIASANNIYITGYDPTDWREPEDTGSNPEYVPQGLETGGILYSGGIEDNTSLFGLIAEYDIKILSQRWPKIDQSANQCWNLTGYRDVAPFNIDLHGAYFARGGTIGYSVIRHGNQLPVDKGYARLFGSMIQDTRGAISVGGVGYGRDFAYDERLLYQAPPYFLEPKDAGWELNEWREVRTHIPAPSD